MPLTPFTAPEGTVECHSHVYDPARFPYPDPNRVFPAHNVADFTAMLARLGVRRAVIVQPSHYMFDNACTLDAVATMNAQHPQNARAVVTPTPDCDAAEIRRLHAAGGRGARFFLPKGLGWEHLERIAALVAPFGWHIQIQDLDGSRLTDQAARLLALPCPVVIDHIGRIPPGPGPRTGATHPAFLALLKMLESGRVWVKLSAPYYSSATGYPYSDAEPRVRALLEARPDRLVWGANWPHPDQDPKPDDVADFALLPDWIPDAALRGKILRDNAEALYFSA
jgi:D-galactarolactone isomerase